MDKFYNNYTKNYKRFIDNKLLNLCLRPHINKYCALFSMTTIYNYLYNLYILPNDILSKIGWTHDVLVNGKIGNRSIINGFYKLSEKKIKPEILLSQDNLDNLDNLDNYWEKIKEYILSEKTVLLYHEHGHYTIICGFIEEPYIITDDINNNFNNIDTSKKNKWLIISEHRCKNENDINNGIFRQINWNNIINEIIKHKIACIFLFINS